MRVEDAIYLAGFFDGEGCISIINNGAYFQLKAFVTLTDLALLEWCARATGLGRIYKVSNGTECHAPQWQWHCAGEETKILAKEILPYLKLKRNQALLAVGFPIIYHGGKPIKHPLSRIGQAVAYTRMRELNKRGPHAEVVIASELTGIDSRED